MPEYPLEWCNFCIAGHHEFCSEPGVESCCCKGQASLSVAGAVIDAHRMFTVSIAVAPFVVVGSTPALDGPQSPESPQREAKPRGDSGYIHPDAWPSTANIGTLTDPESTGRKRVVKMYPIKPGQACEWAGKKGNLGGSPVEVIGCVNNPATDQHHGPDKNTLNNQKASFGIGVMENVHLICSECHNLVHGSIDPLYPPFDRVAQQAQPWLPVYPDGWEPLIMDASVEELMREEERRKASRDKRGRTTRGRNSTGTLGDTDIADE